MTEPIMDPCEVTLLYNKLLIQEEMFTNINFVCIAYIKFVIAQQTSLNSY